MSRDGGTNGGDTAIFVGIRFIASTMQFIARGMYYARPFMIQIGDKSSTDAVNVVPTTNHRNINVDEHHIEKVVSMERPEAYPITYGMLGLLAFWGPMSGYDIKRVFDHTLAPMWGAAHSQIYKELRRMQELGWVDMEREEQEARPDRKVYSITDKGSTALREWQAQPADVFQLRDELLLKVLFGIFAAPEHLAQNLHTAIDEHETRLASYRQASYFIPARGELRHGDKRHNPYATDSEEDPYFGLIAHFAIEFEKTYLRWLHEALDFIEKGQAREE